MNHKETDKTEAAQEDAEPLKSSQQTMHDATADPEERRRLRIQQEDEEDSKYRRRITK